MTRSDRRRIAIGGTIGWAALIGAVVLWQGAQDRGLPSLFAEWQFHVLGGSYPGLTYTALAALALLPVAVLFGRPRRRGSEQRLAAAMLRSAVLFRNTVLAVGAAGVSAAFVTLLLIPTLPTAEGVTQRIDLTQPLITLPREGATVIDGVAAEDLAAAFSEEMPLLRHTQRFAPVMPATGRSRDLQFFVALGAERQTGTATPLRGILRQGALPNELVQLYRYGGYRVEQPYYVLFTDRTALRWSYQKLALQEVLFGLLFVVMGLVQHGRVRAMKRTAAAARTRA